MASKLWDRMGTWKVRLGALSGVLTALVAIGGLIWTGTSVLATDKEVEEIVAKVEEKLDSHIQQQIEADNRAAIQRAYAEIRQIDFQLLDENLPFDKRTFLEYSKQELKDLIACIQDGKQLCEQ